MEHLTLPYLTVPCCTFYFLVLCCVKWFGLAVLVSCGDKSSQVKGKGPVIPHYEHHTLSLSHRSTHITQTKPASFCALNTLYSKLVFKTAGDYLVSGSFAGHLYIWSVKDGTLVKSYQVKRNK